MEQTQKINANSEFERKLNEAKTRYICSLPGKVAELHLVWNQLHQNNLWRKEELHKMQALAHNLAGSGGTFGFKNLSDYSRNLELLLQALQTYDAPHAQTNMHSKVESLLSSIQEIELANIKKTSDSAAANPQATAKDTIYILDADNNASELLAKQLTYYGFKVKVIDKKNDLEATLKNADPLLILVDANFAELDFGKYNIIKTLRKVWAIDCPIVYVSEKTDLDSRMQAIKSGSDAYFTKPLDVPLLTERIQILTNSGISEKYRVLLLEDDKELANYYAAVLEAGGMEVCIETQPELALSKILEFNPELVVMDLYMPNYNGIDLIKTIRQHQSLFTLSIILLTTERDLNLQFLSREVGVDDFLQKPIIKEHLLNAVLNRVRRSRYMNSSMTRDSLTGLLTHRRINELFDMQLKHCDQSNYNLSYGILDIDNFKTINDTYGHLTGDNVLVALANHLKTSVRGVDLVGRYGGEEFVIISPEINSKELFDLLDKVRNEFANMPHHFEGRIFYVRFSAGIAELSKYKKLNMIMEAADKALYHSKNNGRNQITIG